MPDQPATMGNGNKMQKEHDNLRRRAIGIVAQLPDTTACSLTTIEYARKLIVGFLYNPATPHLPAPPPCPATWKEHDGLRRLAVQLVDQLPQTTADALAVLDYAQDLVVGFLCDPALFAAEVEGREGSGCSNIRAFPASSKSR